MPSLDGRAKQKESPADDPCRVIGIEWDILKGSGGGWLSSSVNYISSTVTVSIVATNRIPNIIANTSLLCVP